MNGISPNSQLNFKALVPKSQYSGTPKLQQRVISEISKLKEAIKEADKEIIDLETYINSSESQSLTINYFMKRLSIFKSFRKELADKIALIRRDGNCNSKEHYKMLKNHSEEIEQLDERFEQASKNPKKSLLILENPRKIRF